MKSIRVFRILQSIHFSFINTYYIIYDALSKEISIGTRGKETFRGDQHRTTVFEHIYQQTAKTYQKQ